MENKQKSASTVHKMDQCEGAGGQMDGKVKEYLWCALPAHSLLTEIW